MWCSHVLSARQLLDFRGDLLGAEEATALLGIYPPILLTKGQLFKRSLASVEQNHVLSHFQFAQWFYLNTIYCEKFCERI